MWLSIRFPLLPLETLCQTQNSIEELKPQAIIQLNRIVCANQAAYQRGIKLDQSISSAYALCDEIQLFERNLQQEQQRLNNLALLLYVFSPSISLEESGILLIEIAHSLKIGRAHV